VRAAWLQENGLTEPRTPGDATDQIERAFREIEGRRIDAHDVIQQRVRVRRVLERVLQEAESAQRTLPAVAKSKLRFDWSAEPLKGRAADEDFERRMADFKRRYPDLDFGRER
jgi:hypothetical protein